MRTLTLFLMVFSLSAFAQTRVRENIKQKSVATSKNGGDHKMIKKPAPAGVKQVRR